MNQVLEVIKNRRSVRAYKPEQISEEELSAILEAGIYAPTGHNEQPWHFTVLQDREKIGFINKKAKELMANSPYEWMKSVSRNEKADITYGAPTLIIISCKKNAISGEIDCVAAMENMLIAAESLNIGSVWMGLVAIAFRWEGIREYLQLPEGYDPAQAAVFGYKIKQFKHAPRRKTDVVNYIR